MNRPVLIIGPPRSGTTLLATMLNAHSRLFIANEAKVFVRHLPALGSDPLTESKAQTILDGLADLELHYLRPLPSAREVLSQGEATPPEFFRSLFELLARREGKSRWGEKTAVAYRRLSLIRREFPDAVFLGMERDPYEVGASYLKANPKWGPFGAAIHMIDYRYAVGAEVGIDFLSVSYAKLVAEPEATLRRVCEHIGETFEPRMLEFHRTPRAESLSRDETFAGASKPLYRASEPLPALRSGLRGRLFAKLVTSAPPLDRPTRPRVLHGFARAAILARAVAWTAARKIRGSA